MVENVLNQIKYLGDELEATKAELVSKEVELVNAYDQISKLKSEAVEIDLLHSWIKFLEKENN